MNGDSDRRRAAAGPTTRGIENPTTPTDIRTDTHDHSASDTPTGRPKTDAAR